MLIKAFPHGKGGGQGPVGYVTGTHYHGREESPPTVLRGNPELTKRLIDDSALQGRTWNFTAGVISWHPKDIITPKKEQEVMDAFERVAFAGLEPDACNVLWVRHSHAGHHELHFVIPRTELSTGKAFNPLPPGWQKHMDIVRDLFNEWEGWARPDDPARARTRQPGNTGLINSRRKREGKAEKEDPREMLHAFVEERIAQGRIRNRQDILTSFREVGLEVSRAGSGYITVTLPEDGKNIASKGACMTNLGALNERLQSRLRQDREEIEAQARHELENLSANLSESSANALHTIEAAIHQKSNEINKQYSTMLADLENGASLLHRATFRAWFRNLLMGSGLVAGLALGTWGLSSFLGNKLLTVQRQIAMLEIQKSRLEETVSLLERKSWGLELVEGKEGRFIVPPAKKTLKPGWNVGQSPAWKLE